ncbi:MAG: transglycosylase domain-containing protein, partial [Rudanella sp.]|nr:transglycosylase domain-containing protein [Rudanella sp.]
MRELLEQLSDIWQAIRLFFRRTTRRLSRLLYRGASATLGDERVEQFYDQFGQLRERRVELRERRREVVGRYIDRESAYYPYLRTAWKVFTYGLLTLALYVFGLETNFLWLTGEMPSIEELKKPRLAQSSEIFTLDGKPIGKFYTENRTPIKFENIPKPLINALIATEDARFYKHIGIDIRALGRAMVSFGRDGGCSTITQQLAKNLFKTRKKNNSGLLNKVPFVRKIVYKSKEWLMAIKLERNFTKDEIITYYFNT